MSFCDNKLHGIAACVISVFLLIPFIAGCNTDAKKQTPERNTEAEHMLYGVWFNEDDNSLAFRALGDTIYYPDSTSLPVHYEIIADTLYLYGLTTVAYPIEKQTEHLFIFKNSLGDKVRLVKTNDNDLSKIFEDKRKVTALNQKKLVKSDSVFVFEGKRYHSYVQVNPTTYKVIRPVVNNEGVTVENVYYDNIVNVCIYQLTNKLFSKDFRKEFFKNYIPVDFYESGILSDMMYINCDEDGFHYDAVLYIPDTMTSFIVDVTVTFNGKLKVGVKDKK